MTKRTIAISIRCTPAELRATKRYAKFLCKDVTALVRDHIFTPAMKFNPKQYYLAIYGQDRPPQK